LDYRRSRFTASLIAFYSLQRDLIGYRSGSISGGMMPDIIQLNIGSIDARGVEFDVNANILANLTTYGDIDDDKGLSLKDKTVEYIPIHKFNLGYNWHPITRLTLNANTYYTSQMPYFVYEDNDGIPGPPFTYKRTVKNIKSFINMNAMVKFEIFRNLDLFVYSINLLGESLEQQPGKPIPGRQIYLGIRYQNIIK
jgi:outer membrane receptor for ferrienterochelin and colicin